VFSRKSFAPASFSPRSWLFDRVDEGGSARRRYALPAGWTDDEDDMLLLFAIAAAAHYGVLR
jgi:hypothetical protein